MSRSLVPAVATLLMEATTSTAVHVSERVLAKLVEQLDVDYAFLRHNDHEIRASKLIAEWPPRPNVPDPDPWALVHFASADPVFRLCPDAKSLIVIEPDQMNTAYRHWVAQNPHAAPPLVAAAPLISSEVTTGALGFVKFGGRKWNPSVLNILEAVASLFAQLQARITAEEKLRYLVEHDDLTGLHNRRALIAHLSDRLAAGRPGPVSVLYIDLDRLKSINDYFGHTAGDWFIQLFAKRLRACASSQSMIGRLGGDEFIVIPARPMSIDAAESLADELRTKLCDRLALGGHMITRTVSIGVASGMPGREDSTDLLHHADEAVLAAKRGGGNQVAVCDHVTFKSLIRSDIELLLQDDIDSEALVLHYLPEVDLWTGAILGAEALVRWRHPTRGLLLPDSFMGVAESMNLAGELGRWVIRSACADFSRWRSHGVGHTAILRINVSRAQLATPGFVSGVADTIAEFEINADSVCLEITERAVVHDTETTRRSLAELKEVGVHIAIDDFGTGHAVLSHLKSLPVDMLKIDRQFVRELGTNTRDLAIVRAIIGLAEAFDLQLVAEGVETKAAALTLLQHGCHRAQGFLLSRPIPSNAMKSLLSTRWMPMPFVADSQALSVGAI
ncbi:MAG TPA: bifunctional diguanylate cyclase/phosphodiesterase [Mycobacterium sp.]|nr:bifunctional diguanylate cyclase/phosphodiesterase [Mycobacterium sp.]